MFSVAFYPFSKPLVATCFFLPAAAMICALASLMPSAAMKYHVYDDMDCCNRHDDKTYSCQMESLSYDITSYENYTGGRTLQGKTLQDAGHLSPHSVCIDMTNQATRKQVYEKRSSDCAARTTVVCPQCPTLVHTQAL